MSRLDEYGDLLARWSSRINLVAPSTIADLKSRHLQDCLQLADKADPTDGLWVDLGSGGGLPGLVLAIACAHRPTAFILIESDRRKAVFLRTAIARLGLGNVEVRDERIEAIPPLQARYISARALAALPRLMSYVDRHMAQDGEAWLMKGEQWRAEVTEARTAGWRFDLDVTDSRTRSGAAILRITGLARG